MMRHMQSTNDLSTLFLTTAGFNGSAFKVQIAKKKEQKQITVRHSQERIDIISNQSTHGGLFHHTGGLHLTCDDMFIATEKKLREGEEETRFVSEDAICRISSEGTSPARRKVQASRAQNHPQILPGQSGQQL